MIVLSLVSASKGVGKTTLAVCLAERAQKSNRRPVAFLDLDPDSVLRHLAGENRLGAVQYLPSDPTQLSRDLERLRHEGTAFAIVDAPALPTRALEAAIIAADIVIIPVISSRDGLQSVGTTIELAENCSRRSIFLINGAAGKGVSATVAMALVQHGTLAPVAIPHNDEFAAVLPPTVSLTEADAQKGIETIIDQLWTYLERHFDAISSAAKPISPRANILADRREFPRWQIAWPVTISVRNTTRSGTLKDISGGGASITIDDPPKPGETLEIAVPTLDPIPATVVYSKGNEAAVKFIMDAKKRWRIAEYLAARIALRRRQTRLKTDDVSGKTVTERPFRSNHGSDDMALVFKNFQTCGSQALTASTSPDELATIGHSIDSLADENAALARVRGLMCDQAKNWYELGGVLDRINREHWLAGYNSFNELCENEFGFKKSKAYHLIAIYHALVKLNVPWDLVKSLGWPKLRILCASYSAGKLTFGQFSNYLDKAKTITCAALEAELKNHPVAVANKVKALVLKPHEDQAAVMSAALEKAKLISNAGHDTAAMTYICQDFLAGPRPAASMPWAGNDDDAEIVAWMKSAGFAKVLFLLKRAFPAVSSVNELREDQPLTV